MTDDYKDFAEYILKNYSNSTVVEVGIGSDFKVFNELKKKTDVRAIDINPSSEEVLRDDILNPDLEIYSGAGLIYSIRPPPELVPYIEKIAQKAGADLIVRPLSTDSIPTNAKLQNYRSAIFYRIKQ